MYSNNMESIHLITNNILQEWFKPPIRSDQNVLGRMADFQSCSVDCILLLL